MLSRRAAVEVRERSVPWGLLDYSAAEIRMRLDSMMAFRRTSACRKEPETVEWIESRLRAGDVFYDIGANVGAYSLLAATLAGDGSKVVCFEPSYSNFAALCANIELNHLDDRMIPLQFALGDESRLQTFHYSATAAGTALHHLGDDITDFEPAYRQEMPVFRLDELVTTFDLPQPNCLKLDVDGPELEVLRGAGDLLGHAELRSLLVEIDERQPDAGEITTLLESHGFRVTSRHPRGPTGHLFNVIFDRENPATR